MKQFTINRAKWGCGRENGSLLADDGKLCCLGFFAQEFGKFKSREIIGLQMPSDIYEKYTNPERSKKLDSLKCLLNKKNEDNKICGSLAIINDSQKLSQKTREKKISEKFAKLGYKVKYVGKLEA